MARKSIPDATQNSILTKSRRRCCLCFWLEGKDEVQKGQIAHLDQDSANPGEENLVFLCFDHHDEFDGTPRLAKGLRVDEVRHWRDELYKELEYRFRSVKRRTFELTVRGFRYTGQEDKIYACFKLKNTGEIECRSPTVTIRLPDGIEGEVPEQFDEMSAGSDMVVRMPRIDPWAAREIRSDLFESHGRVCIWELGGLNPVLLAAHSVDFDALGLRLKENPPGSTILLEYRVDAEGMQAITGCVQATLPVEMDDYLPDDEEI